MSTHVENQEVSLEDLPYRNMINFTPEDHKTYTSLEWNLPDFYFEGVVKFLQEKNIKSFIDIGGCAGEVSNILLEKIPTIEYGLVFEPQPENYEFILKNIKSEKVKVENKAVFYGKESISLSIRDQNVGSWSVLFAEKYPQNSVDVECVDLDSYLKDKEYDFVKIDIEGAEFNVIQNSFLLKEVPFVEIEIHYEHFEIYKNQNKEKDLSEYLYEKGNILDFVLECFPNHEMYYYLSGSSDVDQKNPGNIFLVKK